jgi:hypothetical protein
VHDPFNVAMRMTIRAKRWLHLVVLRAVAGCTPGKRILTLSSCAQSQDPPQGSASAGVDPATARRMTPLAQDNAARAGQCRSRAAPGRIPPFVGLEPGVAPAPRPAS